MAVNLSQHKQETQITFQESSSRLTGDGGRMRLATDFAALEAAISPLVAADSSRGGLAALGPPYRLLRACKSLLFADDSQVQEIAKGDIVPGDLLLLVSLISIN